MVEGVKMMDKGVVIKFGDKQKTKDKVVVGWWRNTDDSDAKIEHGGAKDVFSQKE